MSASFVDTNILVYAHDSTAGEKHKRARETILDLWDSGHGCISIQVLQEFYVTVTQKVARPMDSDLAARIIEDLSAWQVHRPGVDAIARAVELQTRFRLSFWDAMILQSAVQMGCEVLLSEDLNAGQVIEGVEIVNPFSG